MKNTPILSVLWARRNLISIYLVIFIFSFGLYFYIKPTTFFGEKPNFEKYTIILPEDDHPCIDYDVIIYDPVYLGCDFDKVEKSKILCKISPHDNFTGGGTMVRLWSDFDGFIKPYVLVTGVEELILEINVEEEYKINNMDKLQIETVSVAERLAYNLEISRTCRIALLLAGNVGSLSADQDNATDDLMVLKYTSKSVIEHFILPNEMAGCEINIFAHSWTPGMEDAIKKYYSHWLVKYEPSIDKGNLLNSIEAAIKLRKEYEINTDNNYDWVFIIRYDVYLFSDFNMTNMNLDLLYTSHTCKATDKPEIIEHPTPEHYKCKPINPEPDHDDEMINDFFFAGSPSTIDIAFVGFLSDIEEQSLPNFQLMHYFGLHLFDLHDKNIIQLGRYRYHEMDYDLISSVIEYPGRLGYKPEYLFWWKKNENLISEEECSYLKQNYPYWDTAINFEIDHRIPRRNSYCGASNSSLFYYCFSKEMEARLPPVFL